MRQAMVYDIHEPVRVHRIAHLRCKLRAPFRGFGLGEIDDRQVRPVHCAKWRGLVVAHFMISTLYCPRTVLLGRRGGDIVRSVRNDRRGHVDVRQ